MADEAFHEAPTGMYGAQAYSEVSDTGFDEAPVELVEPARFGRTLAAISILSAVGVATAVLWGHLGWNPHTPTPPPGEHLVAAPVVVASPPAKAVEDQPSPEKVDSDLDKVVDRLAALKVNPAPEPDRERETASSAPTAADQYLRLLRQDGITITDPQRAVSFGLAVCRVQGNPPYPPGYIVAQQIASSHPGEINFDGAVSIVASAETIYCPQYH